MMKKRVTNKHEIDFYDMSTQELVRVDISDMGRDTLTKYMGALSLRKRSLKESIDQIDDMVREVGGKLSKAQL